MSLQSYRSGSCCKLGLKSTNRHTSTRAGRGARTEEIGQVTAHLPVCIATAASASAARGTAHHTCAHTHAQPLASHGCLGFARPHKTCATNTRAKDNLAVMTPRLCHPPSTLLCSMQRPAGAARSPSLDGSGPLAHAPSVRCWPPCVGGPAAAAASALEQLRLLHLQQPASMPAWLEAGRLAVGSRLCTRTGQCCSQPQQSNGYTVCAVSLVALCTVLSPACTLPFPGPCCADAGAPAQLGSFCLRAACAARAVPIPTGTRAARVQVPRTSNGLSAVCEACIHRQKSPLNADHFAAFAGRLIGRS